MCVYVLHVDELGKRHSEELAYIKQRSHELEVEMLALNQEKAAHFENLTSANVSTRNHTYAHTCTIRIQIRFQFLTMYVCM